MPKWKTHEKWAVRLGIPYEIARKVDYLIDIYGLHDKGRKTRSAPIGEGFKVAVEPGATHLIRILRENFSKDFEIALRAAALHHLLDKIEWLVRHVGYSVSAKIDPKAFVLDAYNSIVNRLRIDLRRYFLINEACDSNYKLFVSALKDVRDQLMPLAKEIIKDIAEELQERNAQNFGPAYVMNILKSLTTYGIVWVNGRPLPLMAAARSITSKLNRKQKVKLRFQTRDGWKSVEVTSLEDLESIRA